MYCLVPEKQLRLVYGTFYLAIGVTFYESINLHYDRVAIATPVATITLPAALLSLRAAFLFVNI